MDTRPDDEFWGIFQVVPSVVHPNVYPCHLMVVTCALMDIRTSQAMDRSRRRHILQFTFMCH